LCETKKINDIIQQIITIENIVNGNKTSSNVLTASVDPQRDEKKAKLKSKNEREGTPKLAPPEHNPAPSSEAIGINKPGAFYPGGPENEAADKDDIPDYGGNLFDGLGNAIGNALEGIGRSFSKPMNNRPSLPGGGWAPLFGRGIPCPIP
jgi:hypothetical protein